MANYEKEFDQMKDEVQSLRTELKSLAESWKRQAEAQARAGYEKVREAGGRAREQAKAGADALGDQIEERPLISVMTAFGVGFVIGKLLGRR